MDDELREAERRGDEERLRLLRRRAGLAAIDPAPYLALVERVPPGADREGCRAAWSALCLALHALPEDHPGLPELVATLDAALAGWPDAAREAMQHWGLELELDRRVSFDRDAQEEVVHEVRTWRGLRARPHPAWTLGRVLDGVGIEELDGRALAALAAWPHAARLTELTLRGDWLDAASLAALGRSALRPTRLYLTAWRSSGRPAGPGAALAIAEGPAFARLRHLHLGHHRIGPEGAAALARAGLAELETLDLRWNALGDAGLAALCAAPWRLTRLDAAECDVGPAGAAALAASHLPRTLVDLWLQEDELGDDGVVALAAADWPALRQLWLSGSGLGERGAAALAGARGLAGLERLRLGHHRLGPEARALLRASPFVGRALEPSEV